MIRWRLRLRPYIICQIREHKLAVCVNVVSLLLAMSIIALAHREHSDNLVCRSKLKQLWYSIHQYEDAFGCMPPAYITDESGRVMHSWRSLILPFCELGHIYDQYNFSEPWNSPSNSQLLMLTSRSGASGFRCPTDTSAPFDWTSYVGVVDKDSCWLGNGSLLDNESNSDRVLLIEIPKSGIVWMEPRDISPGEAISMLSVEHSRHRLRLTPRSINYVTNGGRVGNALQSANFEHLKSRAVAELTGPTSGYHTSAKLVKHLESCLSSDQHLQLRLGAALILGQMEAAAEVSLETLRRALNDEDEKVRLAVVLAIRKIEKSKNRRPSEKRE